MAKHYTEEEVKEMVTKASEREEADDHLDDSKRRELVHLFEKYLLPASGYPMDGSMIEKYLFIIFEW